MAALGLNLGQLASARMAPVFGSCTMTVPAGACVFSIAAANSRSAMYWIFSSIVRTTLTPRSRCASPPSNQRFLRVGHHHNFFAFAADQLVVFVLDSPESLFVNIHKSQNMRGQVALRVVALIFFLEINALQVQGPHGLHFFRRQFSLDPNKGGAGFHFFANHFLRRCPARQKASGRPCRASFTSVGMANADCTGTLIAKGCMLRS